MTQHQSVTKTTRSQCMLRCCASCACSCSCHCTCCWCGLSHACPQCSCSSSCCIATVFVASFLQYEVYYLHILPFSTLLHGHLALAFPSLLETDPQMLGHWGCADEDHLGKLLQAMVFGLECWRGVPRFRWVGRVGWVSVWSGPISAFSLSASFYSSRFPAGLSHPS